MQLRLEVGRARPGCRVLDEAFGPAFGQASQRACGSFRFGETREASLVLRRLRHRRFRISNEAQCSNSGGFKWLAGRKNTESSDADLSALWSSTLPADRKADRPEGARHRVAGSNPAVPITLRD
jgi:hypothetical protein